MAHDDSTGEESDDTWESHELSEKVGKITVEKNETGFLDRMFIDRLVHFEKIAQSEAANGSKSYTEEK